METRIVTIDRAPPKRLLADSRWRTFKTQPDREVWRQCLTPAQRLLDDGWRVARVSVTWGKSYPGEVGERVLRPLLLADDDVLIATQWKPSTGRGRTMLVLER